jgi:hypothetical protein
MCRINIRSFPGYSKNKIENIRTRNFLRMTGKNQDLKKLLNYPLHKSWKLDRAVGKNLGEQKKKISTIS